MLNKDKVVISYDPASPNGDFTAYSVVKYDEEGRMTILESDTIKHTDEFDVEKQQIVEEKISSLKELYNAEEVIESPKKQQLKKIAIVGFIVGVGVFTFINEWIKSKRR